jgi:hypothetical protein
MTPLFIIAGVLAALICFRWARTLLIFGIAAMAVWFFMTHAHAQQSALVQCRVGATIFRSVPDYACDALMDGFKRITNDASSIAQCSGTMSRHFQNGAANGYYQPCQRMWADKAEYHR